MKTKISVLRAGGKGIAGTIANAHHHAEAILPFIDQLKDVVGKLDFAEWKQGHNIHEFITHDKRRFTLRAYTRNGVYRGLRLSLRVSRSVEHRLADIHNLREVPMLISMMMLLAGPMLGDHEPVLAPSSN